MQRIGGGRCNWPGAKHSIGDFQSEFRILVSAHYQDQAGYLTRQEASRKLEAHLPDYKKSDVLYRSALVERTETAIDRAKKISHLAMLNGVGLYDNPCTHVWGLVELLLRLQNENR